MNVLVGLGNPGKKYSDTKHNFGFWVIDKFATNNHMLFKAGKSDYLIAKSDSITCIKPTTYMNSSGTAVLDYFQYYKASIKDLLVIYDDIDLSLGMLRFRATGGSGGHKGIESIIYHLQSEKFDRLRIGIATNEEIRPSEKYVLSPFKNEDKKLKSEMVDRACDGIYYYFSHDMKETMNKYNEKKQERD